MIPLIRGPRLVKFTGTESRIVVVLRGWGDWGGRSGLAGTEFPLCKMARFRRSVAQGSECTPHYRTLLLKTGAVVNSVLYAFCHNYRLETESKRRKRRHFGDRLPEFTSWHRHR